MNAPLGSSRNVVTAGYALFTPAGFVPSALPGWSDCTPHVLISEGLGANFVQMLVPFEKGAVGRGNTAESEMFIYVVDGKCSAVIAGKKHQLASGHYAYLPPNTEYQFTSIQKASKLLIFQKRYQPLEGAQPPGKLVGDSKAIEGQPFLGNSRARLQVLLPETIAFDLAVNIFTYEPGAALPFVETHVMEHGLLMLEGAGIYRLDDDWHPVQTGDVIWMAPYCPQWFVAMGDVPARYIYYKDVNRSPL